MTIHVLVPLAEGFEEIEAVTPIDVLRRAGVDVTVASVGGPVVKGARGILLEADKTLDECADKDYDMIVLPGGMPGAVNLAGSAVLAGMLRRHREKDLPLAAICAAPAVVLNPLGLLGENRVACHPSVREKLGDTNRTEERICVGKKLVTAAGPGVAMEFALALVELLQGREKAEELAKAMVVI
ncbi:4-methyl-5(b-hydroxyethyl)-thiazole monophosphate biosynthesis [Aminivibrio pyruvatiphilus]|uniref:4-methyl-5(B-hydroxyethyl)-thiazole monophosphate biosynthesis n=1 Tax=Aminivibrio pyruvatiphilus TaxID=1005740 RepID=A0A4R8LXS4_9BACT|nr:DJ-1 family glyoxalase III [Aminivibrio pyruvatiphilus]TDY53046.1 4-methyl-5(b-hydroxyethyl)-thiazole monophosphate biosynthesis [Aminivibrio pyruvatiphilus]